MSDLLPSKPYIASAVIGGTTYQVVGFWDENEYANIAVREIGGAWTVHTYDGAGGLPTIQATNSDPHRYVVVGLDADGYVHVSYDMHNEALNYRRSDKDVTSWTGGLTAELPMLDTDNENNVTYPVFTLSPTQDLYVFFRYGLTGDGDTHLYVYDTSTQSWSGAPGTGTNGIAWNGRSVTPDESAYVSWPAWDANGNLHFLFHWREIPDTTTAHDICYVRYTGAGFEKADGTAQTVPITPTNCEIVVSTGQGSDILAWPIAVDSSGNPHLSYRRNDGAGLKQLHLARWNGSEWLIGQITSNETDVTSLDAFNMFINDGAVYLIARNNETGDAQTIYYSDDYSTWEESELTQSDLIRQLDERSWRVDGVAYVTVFGTNVAVAKINLS